MFGCFLFWTRKHSQNRSSPTLNALSFLRQKGREWTFSILPSAFSCQAICCCLFFGLKLSLKPLNSWNFSSLTHSPPPPPPHSHTRPLRGVRVSARSYALPSVSAAGPSGGGSRLASPSINRFTVLLKGLLQTLCTKPPPITSLLK